MLASRDTCGSEVWENRDGQFPSGISLGLPPALACIPQACPRTGICLGDSRLLSRAPSQHAAEERHTQGGGSEEPDVLNQAKTVPFLLLALMLL